MVAKQQIIHLGFHNIQKVRDHFSKLHVLVHPIANNTSFFKITNAIQNDL